MIEDFAGYVSRMFRVQREHSSRLPERPPVEEDDLLPSTLVAAGMADAESAWPEPEPEEPAAVVEPPASCVVPGCGSEPIRVRPGYEDRCLEHILPIGLGDARPTMPWGGGGG